MRKVVSLLLTIICIISAFGCTADYALVDGEYVLTLPVSNKKITVQEEYVKYLPEIDMSLLRAADKKYIDKILVHDEEHIIFLSKNSDDYLCLYAEVIVWCEKDEIDGFSDHKHVILNEPITAKPMYQY